MKNFETIKISNLENLKAPTIYFYLINNGFSQTFVSALRNMENSIKLNGKFVTIREKIKSGDLLEIMNNPYKKSEILPCDGKLEILFEDDDFLIINKPHNLSCMPTRSHYYNNLGGQICKYMNQKTDDFVLRIINRLDKETAGIVVVAKNVIAYNNTCLDKTYYALCEGNIFENFTIDAPIETIVKNGINEHKRVISENGKPAVTHVFPIKNFDSYCLAKFKLETGRTHQIRVHLSSKNHSLIGDCVYGEPNDHAFLILKEVSFKHFRTNQLVKIEVDFPSDWNKFITKNSHDV